jgi:hypothetical protein
MNLTFVVSIWAVLGIVTLALAIYRSAFSAHSEEDVVHLGPGEEREIPKQVALAHKMDAIDRWGKILTIVVVVIGLGLAAAYLYQAWLDPSSVPPNFYRRTTP